MGHMNAKMEECIAACLDCYQSCIRTGVHCLEMGGEHAARDHQFALQDCAELCHLMAGFVLRGSSLHGELAGLCAEACKRCAERCEEIADGDPMMLGCAEACRRCEAICQEAYEHLVVGKMHG